MSIAYLHQPPLPPVPPLPTEVVVQTGGPPEAVMIASVLIIGIMVAGIVFWPLIRAWARRIEGKTDSGLAFEVDQLRTRVAELEQVHHRVAELEERVDFSERLLTRGREGAPVERREG